MTPTEYLQRYRNLQVTLLDGRTIFNVDVHEYRNATSYYHHVDPAPGDDHHVYAGMSKYGELWRAIRRRGISISAGTYQLSYSPSGEVLQRDDTTSTVSGTLIVERSHIKQPFHGKGSPEEIELVLKLAVGCGLITPATRDEMQRFCNANIGLDCNGFVGNYVRAEGHGTLGPSTYIPSFAATGTKRSAMSEIQPKDVVVFTNGSHIMAIDSITSTAADSFECRVAESCGSSTVRSDAHTDGLNDTFYSVLSVDRHKVFTVHRGRGWESASRQNNFSVYIVGVL